MRNEQPIPERAVRLHRLECFRLALEPLLEARDRLGEIHDPVAGIHPPGGGGEVERCSAARVGKEHGEDGCVVVAEVGVIATLEGNIRLAGGSGGLRRWRPGEGVAEFPGKGVASTGR